MSYRKVPRRVQVNYKWYDVREGWAKKLELYEYMKAPEFTANEPFVHISNLYHVYNINGIQVGEFNTENRTWSGVVNGFEM